MRKVIEVLHRALSFVGRCLLMVFMILYGTVGVVSMVVIMIPASVLSWGLAKFSRVTKSILGVALVAIVGYIPVLVYLDSEHGQKTFYPERYWSERVTSLSGEVARWQRAIYENSAEVEVDKKRLELDLISPEEFSKGIETRRESNKMFLDFLAEGQKNLANAKANLLKVEKANNEAH